MTSKKQEQDNSMPIVDESWWESVLAEEARHPAHAPGRSSSKLESRGESRSEEATRISPNWVQVKDLYQKDQIVDLKVTGCNRGGLLVEGENLYGFVPFSHLVDMAGQVDLSVRERYLEGYVGRTLRLKVIECVPEDGRIVFSERAAQAEPGKRSQLFHSLHAGECVQGTVTNITDFGVFVDLGGVEGLIHISELSWGRVIHPNQIVRMGQPVQVQILDLSPERCRVALSLKRLSPNPWARIGSDLSVGDVVPAVITSVLSYGAFARLELGVEGLIHASEMPLADGQGVKDFIEEGQRVNVRILHVDPSRQRMGLSMNLHVQ
ncbi:MAG TPA: S1 RNA-binding domain-containing protein [Anaerolineales bacterium]